MVTITTTKRDLLKTLKMVKTALRGKRALHTTCEVTVTDGKAAFAVPGAIFNLVCETKGTAKATFLFMQLFDIVSEIKEKQIALEITEGWINTGKVTFKARTTFFNDDRILRTIHLPIDYTDWDLLKLSESGYTVEELVFNRLHLQVNAAKKRFAATIRNTHRQVKKFGVPFEEFEALVMKYYKEKMGK